MNITQSFYDNLASEYDKLFSDWKGATREQAEILHRLFVKGGFDKGAHILDCACGIGTQAIGLARIGYNVTASDISECEIDEAEKRAREEGIEIKFKKADFCNLSESFDNRFDIVIAMDNALPHMLSSEKLAEAIRSITERIRENGFFVGSIRDYDALLKDKPPYSPPYIHKTLEGQRVSFQTWEWNGDKYRLVQYIVDDGKSLSVSRFECEYRATRRQELTELFYNNGCREVEWLFPEETGFYQPVVVVRR